MHFSAIQELEHLGFVINSKLATVSISNDKWRCMRERVGKAMLAWPNMSVRQLLSVAGSIVSLKTVLGDNTVIFMKSIFRATGG